MKLSIVVPTLGNKILLDALWDSLVRNSLGIGEILVIRQGADHSWYPSKTEALPWEFRIINVYFIGLSKAKNLGILEAKGDYILFIDDDARLLPDSISSLKHLINANPGVDVFFGRTVDEQGNDTVTAFATEADFLKPSNYRNRFIECPSCFSRDLLLEVNGFDEKMGAGMLHGAEEGHDLVLRLLKKNCRMYFSPHFCVYHPSKLTDYSSEQAIRRSFFYRAGTSYLSRKHGKYIALFFRLSKVLAALPFLAVVRPRKVRFYLAEVLGTLAGLIVK